MVKPKIFYLKNFILVLLTFLLSGCSSNSFFEKGISNYNSSLNKVSEWKKFADEGFKFLKKGQYDLASKSFNDALKYDIKNSNLQALNGIAYHLSAKNYDANNYKLAKQGYSLASKFDPANWMPHYLNGLVNFKQNEFNLSKDNFTKAAIRNWDNNEILLSLISASYHSLDFEMSARLIKHLKQRTLPSKLLLELNRSCALVFSTTKDLNYRDKCLNDYLINETSSKKKYILKKKIKFWNSLKNINSGKIINYPKLIKTQTTTSEDVSTDTQNNTTETIDDDVISNSANYKSYQDQCVKNKLIPGTDDFTKCIIELVDDTTQKKLEEEDITDERMVIVDVVIIGSSEDIRNRSGINILDGLVFQFGDKEDGEDAYSKINTITTDQFDFTNNAQSKTVVKALTIPAIEYSLNIINSSDNDSKILAKPSLIALSGEESTFFSGVTINGAATSGTGDSVTIEKEIGVTLSVTPEFISNSKVYLTVAAERTFLIDPKSSVLYEYRMDTTKTTVSANVVLNIGETLILGGLTEQQDSETLDGVPILRDIPVVKLLFAEDIKRYYKKSVTILLTPRLSSMNNKKSKNIEKIYFQNPDNLILDQLLNDKKRPRILFQNNLLKFKNLFGKRFISKKDFNIHKTNKDLIKLAGELRI